nr:hypothetical protein BaRGS_031194 [Batillaria attramentaria]
MADTEDVSSDQTTAHTASQPAEHHPYIAHADVAPVDSTSKTAVQQPDYKRYINMIATAIYTLSEDPGSSRRDIRAFIMDKYTEVGDDEEEVTRQLRTALMKGIEDGYLKRVGYRFQDAATKKYHCVRY